MLPIRQHLLTLTCLKSTAKTVLIEVCGLAENGGKGACFASNQALADSLGLSKATVVRQVELLEAGGLLSSTIVKAEGNRRYLRPTARLRACYTGGSEAAQLLAASNLTIVKGEPAAEVDYSQKSADYSQKSADYSQNCELTIVKSEVDYSQNSSRVIGDQHYQQVDQQNQHSLPASERVRLEKKIQELEHENAQLRAQLQAQTPAPSPPGCAAPPAPPPAEPTGLTTWQRLGHYRDFEASWPEQLKPHFGTPAFLAAWGKYAGYRSEIGKGFRGNIGEQEALDTLHRYAAGDQGRALRILSHNITQGYKTLTNDDGAQSPRPAASGGPRSAGAGRVETLEPTRYGRNRGPAQPASPEAEPAEAA